MLVVMVSVTFQHLIGSVDKDQRLNIDWILDSCPDYKKKKGHLPVETSIFCGHGINNYILDRRFTFVTVKIPIQPDFFFLLLWLTIPFVLNDYTQVKKVWITQRFNDQFWGLMLRPLHINI